MNKFYELLSRMEIPIYTKMKPIPDKCNVVNYKKEKLYKYYKCDYCGAEIVITGKKQEMTGGIATIPHTVTKKGRIKVSIMQQVFKTIIKRI